MNKSTLKNKSLPPFSAEGLSCGCGCNHNATAGVGHNRALGKIGIAIIGGILVANSYLLAEGIIAQFSALAGALLLSAPIIWQAIQDILHGIVRMNELVAVAILAALAGADYQTAGIIAFFLLLTIIIETRTASGAQRAIEELIRLTPKKAHKILDSGLEQEVDAQALQVGDLIHLRPGESFPADGVLQEGQTTVNQATITGESLPVDKSTGDDVFAGTQNLTGAVIVKVSRVGEDTTLGKVKEMILQAERTKPPVVRLIDSYARYYTPAVMILGALVWWLSGGNMEKVITLLVIACPCTLVLATPTAIVAAIAAGARLGILIKHVGDLELAAKIRIFIFDKTGTLTEGILALSRLTPVDSVQPAELLQIAASIESHSNHPVAVAMVKTANEVNIPLLTAQNTHEIHGQGVEGIIEGVTCRIGRRKWLADFGITCPSSLPDPDSETGHEGMSVIYVAKGTQILGWIGFSDQIRPEAIQAISILKKEGVKKCAMVTGDREPVAAIVSRQLGMDEFQAAQLPEGKVAYVEQQKLSGAVAVVGDGVNDAPALAAGNLSIAMGTMGSDIAIGSASIALMSNDLRRIPMLIRLSRQAIRIINQNLLFGICFVFGGIILSVFGALNPITAAILHTGGTVLVIFNSARLVRTGEELTHSQPSLDEDY